MAYQLYDADKKDLGSLTVSSWTAIYKAAKKSKTKCPAIGQLFSHGYTNLLVALKVECKQLIRSNPDLSSSLTVLLSAANQADEIVALGS